MANVPIRLSCGFYDRVLALYTGEVKPEGIDLTFVPNDDPRDLFDRLMRSAEFDVAEMSSSEYIARASAGDRTFVALPVFPSRLFRHGFITINRRSGIQRPKDIEGRRIGVQLYTMTAAIFIRGLLQHESGVDLSSIRWVQGAIEKPGPHGRPSVPALLKPVDLEINESRYSLSELLERGEIDALVASTLPPALHVNPDVQRLFPDFATLEADYYRRTRIFPIMHLLVVRRAVYERNPFIAKSLFDAFCAAKTLAVNKLHFFGALCCTLPWLVEAVEQMDRVFGPDPWPYGIEPNRPTLEAMTTYMVEQSIIASVPPLDELFLTV
jgi:4,5-dihydroxyphthalate decarboxylase